MSTTKLVGSLADGVAANPFKSIVSRHQSQRPGCSTRYHARQRAGICSAMGNASRTYWHYRLQHKILIMSYHRPSYYSSIAVVSCPQGLNDHIEATHKEYGNQYRRDNVDLQDCQISAKGQGEAKGNE
jgi:hypothetical protein